MVDIGRGDHQVEELPETPGRDDQRLLAHRVSQLGRYEGAAAPRSDDERVLAQQVLRAQAVWWEPASTAGAHRDPAEPFAPVYYRVSLDRVTGHRATPDTRTVNPPAAAVRNERWLSRALRLGRRPLPHCRAGATYGGGGSRLKRGGFAADGVRIAW